MNVSIVIPVYNALPLARQCLKSVFEHGTALMFEVIVVDNGSAPDVEQWLLELERTHANLRHLRYAEPLGFARSVNAGAAAAAGEVLIILNSDTLVTPGWMDELHRVLLADPTLGALTPATNHAGEPAQMDFGTVDLPAAKAIATFARRAMHQKPPSTLYLPQRLTFFCVAFRRSVWLEFHGLDEGFRVGNYEDDDLCLRLRVAGYRLGVARHVFVYHHNNATFRANKISHSGWMTENAARFADHARLAAEATEGSTSPRWPRSSVQDLSVVVLPDTTGSLDRTLRSISNQTIQGFEVLLPGQQRLPTGQWIAYVTQGNILYPFHLEALLDAMERNGSEAIFADGWLHGTSGYIPHPDTATSIRKAPLLLSGWVHHASLHPDLVWDECVPMHWPRLTWEMQHAPILSLPSMHAGRTKRSFIDWVRRIYRKLVPYETRLQLDRNFRRLLNRPRPDPDKVLLEELTAHLESMATNKADAGNFATASVLPAVFLFNAIQWCALTQRQHHFARGLAERGHTVFWVEPTLSPLRNWRTSRPLQQVAPGIFLLRLPGLSRDIYHMEWNENILGAILDAMSAALRQTVSAYAVANAVMLVNYPRWQPIVTRMCERHGWKIINDCLDDNRAFSGLYQTVMSSFEDRLVDSADRLITSSLVLQQRLMPRTSLLLHNAADFDLFSSAVPAGHLQHLSRPIVGFFGALADWLDMPLIHDTALRFPDWSFVYIGPNTFSQSEIEVEWLRSTDLPNILVLPQMGPRELSAHLAEFDLCIIPFRDIPATRTMNPVKLYEYLAAGKPTISRDLPEVRHIVDSGADGLVALYTTPQQFFDCLNSALVNDTPVLREKRKAFARDNDWSKRVDQLSALIVDVAKETATE